MLAALAAPADDTVRSELSVFFAEPLLGALATRLDQLVADGLLGRPNPDVPSRVSVVELVEVSADPSSTPTIVRVCRVDAAVIYEPVEGGGEIIVNDSVDIVAADSRLFLVNETWALSGGDPVAENNESLPCPE